jgi:hypothetical protein
LFGIRKHPCKICGKETRNKRACSECWDEFKKTVDIELETGIIPKTSRPEISLIVREAVEIRKRLQGW